VKDAQQEEIDKQMYIPTADHRPHILGETVNDLKRLCRRCPSLVLGQSVQPLKNRLDPILSKELLYEFLCIAFSKMRRQ